MSAPLTIVFMGTPDFAVPSLQALLAGPNRVAAVVCQPDRGSGRGKKVSPPPVKVVAEQAGLPVLQPESVRTPAFLETIRSLAPDLLVVVAYGRILPGSLLRLAPLGAINVHGSLLPRYRGAAPIQWAIINGERETGITIMQLDSGMDTGPVLLSVPEPIGPEDTAGDLFTRLAALGGRTLTAALDRLRRGELEPVPQDHSRATLAPMLTKEQGHLDWNRPAAELHCLIRGLDPWPSAYAFLDNLRLRLFRPEVVVTPADLPPGTISRADKEGLLVATADHCLRIREVQPEGRKRMPVAAWVHGVSIPAGARLS